MRPQLRMRFNRFYDLPRGQLGSGVTVRRYQAGDEVCWADLLQRNRELGEWSETKAKEAMTGSARVDAQSIHFLMVNGKPVATACLQIDERNPAEAELGYVAVLPEYRGRGFGRLVSTIVLRYIEERGYRRCMLKTDDHRLSAIKTYLGLGFEPDMTDSSYPARWEAVWKQLDRYPRRHALQPPP